MHKPVELIEMSNKLRKFKQRFFYLLPAFFERNLYSTRITFGTIRQPFKVINEIYG